MIGLLVAGRLDWVETLGHDDLVRFRDLDAEYDLLGALWSDRPSTLALR